MTLVGSICRQGGPRERRALLTALRKGEANLDFEYQREGGSPNSQEKKQQRTPSLDDTEPVADIGLYTLILKEHGDRVGVIPSYETETIGRVPPRFMATLSFNGALFIDQGSSKNKAKHMASRRACESLHLKLR